MVGISVSVSPMMIWAVLLFNVTLVGTIGITCTVEVAVRALSSVVAVMVAIPGDTAVTTPLASTVAIDVLLLRQLTFWLVALAGVTVAINAVVSPMVILTELLFNVTFVGRIGATITTQVAVSSPSSVVAVIIAVPTPTAVTTPVVLTIAMSWSLLDHVTFWLAAFQGATLTVKVRVPPTFSGMSGKHLSIVMLVGAIGVTVTTQVAVSLPSSVVTVMVAVPAAMALTNPLASTVATLELLLLHVTF